MKLKQSEDSAENFAVYNRCFDWIEIEEFTRRFSNVKFYIIYDGLTGDTIKGFVTITDRNEIGYGIQKADRRKGLAKKAIEELMKLENRKYYWALIDKNNEGSMNFIQSLKFVPRGIVYGINRD